MGKRSESGAIESGKSGGKPGKELPNMRIDPGILELSSEFVFYSGSLLAFNPRAAKGEHHYGEGTRREPHQMQSKLLKQARVTQHGHGLHRMI